MVGAMLSPGTTKAEMPTAMKIYVLQTLTSKDKKAKDKRNIKLEEPIKAEQKPQEQPIKPKRERSEEEKQKARNIALGVCGASVVLLGLCVAYDLYTKKRPKNRERE